MKPIDPRLLIPVTPLDLLRFTKGKYARSQLAKCLKDIFISRGDYWSAVKFRDMEFKK